MAPKRRSSQNVDKNQSKSKKGASIIKKKQLKRKDSEESSDCFNFYLDNPSDVSIKSEESDFEDSFSDESFSEETPKKRKSTKQVKKTSIKKEVSKKNTNPKTASSKKSIEKSQKIIPEEISEDYKKEELTLEDLTNSLPEFISKEKIKDKNGKRPTDPNYDPTTLMITESQLKSLPKTMQQYWQIKSNHYDKIVVFKWWKFYYTWYEDAIVMNKECDYRIRNSWQKYPACFFHESLLKKVVPKLTAAGYKIVVVEQMEPYSGEGKDIIEREIVQVITPGTIIEIGEDQDFAPRFMITLVENQKHFGFTLVDMTRQDIILGEFIDDFSSNKLRTLLLQTRPVEILSFQPLSKDTVNVIRGIINKPSFTVYTRIKLESVNLEFKKLQLIFEDNKLPEIFEILESSKEELKMIISSLSLTLQYLKFLLHDELVIPFSSYSFYEDKKILNQKMILDSQVLQNLELIESLTQTRAFSQFTLFSYMDKTMTPMGKRMLRNWILEPLKEVNYILERQAMIQDLNSFQDYRDSFRNELKEFGDLERQMYRVTSYNHKILEAEYFEINASINKLKEFYRFLCMIKKYANCIEKFSNCKSYFKSPRLKKLTSYISKDGFFPDLIPIINDLERIITIRDDVPFPARGIDPSYDMLFDKIQTINEELIEHISKLKESLGLRTINYVHSKHVEFINKEV